MRETIRAWIEALEAPYLETIFEKRRGKRAALARSILFGASKLYQLYLVIHRFAIRSRLIRDYTLGIQVIAIGNLTFGGTGKTPVVEKFARELQKQGRTVAILSRGFRSKPQPFGQMLLNKLLLREDSTPPRVVSDGKSLLLDSDTAGDEPYMLASNLKDVVVLVDKDRVKSGRYAIENFGCDTLLLDDGFQYWRLAGRRQDVVLVDCQQPFGNEHLLPRGTLREPPSHLARASVIFITKSDGQTAELRKRIAQYSPGTGIIECIHAPLYFEDVFTGERKGLDFLKDQRVASLSGIAQPESFEQSLVKLCRELVYSKRFADHHRFSQQEILNAINRSKKRQAQIIVTTQKDAVRFPKLDRRDLPIYFMRVEIKILSGAEDFDDCVQNLSSLNMPDPTEKILVRGLNWLGDAIMSTPALERLRQARPSAHITLLSPEKLAGLWQAQPFLDEVLTFSESDNIWNVVFRLREEKFSEAVAFPNSIRAALELCLAGIPRRVGLARPGRGLLLTRLLPPRPGAVPMHKRSPREIRRLIARNTPPAVIPSTAHHIHDYLYLTSELGASLEPLPPRILVSDQQVAELCQKLRLENAPAGRPWFGLNPGAEYGPAKRWPVKRFAAAAVMLQKQTHCRWLVFGGPGDLDIAEKVTTEIRYGGNVADGVLNLAGKTSLRELAAAFKICRLLLTNDSGPMHLASAVGTPVIVPFGSTSPELTGPSFSPCAQIVQTPVPCAPCFRRECPIDLRCLNDIKIAQVIEAARRILDGKS